MRVANLPHNGEGSSRHAPREFVRASSAPACSRKSLLIRNRFTFGRMMRVSAPLCPQAVPLRSTSAPQQRHHVSRSPLLLRATHTAEAPSNAEKADFSNQLEALKSMSKVVADTGEFESIRAFKPIDCTTNPRCTKQQQSGGIVQHFTLSRLC
jgi:hypothetical protein